MEYPLVSLTNTLLWTMLRKQQMHLLKEAGTLHLLALKHGTLVLRRPLAILLNCKVRVWASLILWLLLLQSPTGISSFQTLSCRKARRPREPSDGPLFHHYINF
ncbi:hypothetical protein I7I53_04858 [Histoplasma capsulatum var. duboisii H88]|uniref:Uncharacterized protein n=1 Tax=Ajellomyces capsulatus (strain H88) TaxID=544711 RepID=A0A8A1LQQ6_AJEC8|nr:hypothetical protein I7I53_04858 [Histoplasma capsulatum var. duboisii H88]